MTINEAIAICRRRLSGKSVDDDKLNEAIEIIVEYIDPTPRERPMPSNDCPD